MLAAASRGALQAARDRLGALVAGLSQPDGVSALADGLFAVVPLLDGSGQLRRTVGDPTTPAPAKRALVDSLFSGKIDAAALELLQDVVALRWSTSRDLVDAIEVLAVQARFLVAEADGSLDDIEDELFRFSRIIVQDPELRSVLTDNALDLERKSALLDGLLTGKAHATTLSLIVSLVGAPRGRTLEDGLAEYAELAALIRQRSVAQVTSAVRLDEAQQERLAAGLARVFGRDVQLLIDIDPSLIGGIVVRVGDEIIDGSIVTRLLQARRGLVGS